MKNNYFLRVYLFLLLIVPSSILYAQITKTLNGTVSYDKGMSKSTLVTKKGKVVVQLPQDMSGTTITGTVSVEPTGNTKREKKKNLKGMLAYGLNLGGQKISLSESSQTFDCVVTPKPQQRTPLELMDGSGKKIAEVSLPPVLSAPAILNPGNAPRLSTPSKAIVKGDALNIYTDQQFTVGQQFVLTDANGQQHPLKPVCLSAQQAVLKIPGEVSPGECTVTEQSQNQPAGKAEMSMAKFNLIDIFLSSPNTNLKPGQQSFVKALVVWNSKSASELQYLNMELRNLNSSIVSMAGGNVQRINIVPDISTAFEDQSVPFGDFQVRRNITGITVGSFSVSATLNEDYNSSNDPFRPQLKVLKTPADFNNWTSALKKDLNQFADLSNKGAAGQAAGINAKRAIDNMPTCADMSQLDECKAVAYSLLKPVQVPMGAAVNWLSSYEAAKAASGSIDAGNAEKTLLSDINVIKNGLEFVSRATGPEGIQHKEINEKVNEIQAQIDEIETTGETPVNVQGLKNELQKLVSEFDSKISSTAYPYVKYDLNDLNTSLFQLPSIAPPGRVHPFNDLMGYLDPELKTLFVLPQHRASVLSMLDVQELSTDKYRINSLTAQSKPVTYDITLSQVDPYQLYNASIKKEDYQSFLIDNDEPEPDPYTDEMGTKFKFYLNAKCSEEVKPFKGECKPQTMMDMRGREVLTGNFELYQGLGLGKCKAGKSTCTEMYKITNIYYVYKNKDCKDLIELIPSKEFSCK